MTEVEYVKMSTKGQLVVPREIREEAGLKEGEKFVAFPIKGGVIFKRIKLPEIKFEEIAKEVREHFRKNKITKADVDEAVKWARNNRD
jgi:antitoxin PrlF